MREIKEGIPHRPEADSFDVRASLHWIWSACSGHKLLILLTCVFTVGLVLAYVFIWPPVYIGEVMMAAESEEDSSRNDFYKDWNVFRKDELTSEVELMKARPVLEAVVRKLDLGYDDVYHPFLRYASHLWQESWLGKNYRKVKLHFFPKPESPYDPSPEEIKLAKTLSDFDADIQLVPVPDTHVGTLTVKAPSPRVAEIANTIAEEYLKHRRERHVAEARDAVGTLQKEVERARDELATVENEMKEYYGTNELLLEFEKDKVEIGRLVALRSTVIDTESKIAMMETTAEELRQKLAKEPKDIDSARTFRRNDLLERMNATRFDLTTQLEDRLRRFNSDAPEVQDLQHMLAAIDTLIKNEDPQVEYTTTTTRSTAYEELRGRLNQIEADMEGARSGLKIMQAASSELETRLGHIPEKMKTVHGLGRRHAQVEKKYTLLHERLTMAQVSMAVSQSTAPSLRIVSGASPPSDHSWPRTKLLLLAAVGVGLAAGVGLAMMMETLHGRVTRHRLTSTGAELPVYATISMDSRSLARHGSTITAGNGHGRPHHERVNT